MTTLQTSEHEETVRRFLTEGRRITWSPSTRRLLGAGRIKFESGTDEISINLGSDGKWRYGFHSTYGNGSFVYGCPDDDAYGHVVKSPDLTDRLNLLDETR